MYNLKPLSMILTSVAAANIPPTLRASNRASLSASLLTHCSASASSGAASSSSAPSASPSRARPLSAAMAAAAARASSRRADSSLDVHVSVSPPASTVMPPPYTIVKYQRKYIFIADFLINGQGGKIHLQVGQR